MRLKIIERYREAAAQMRREGEAVTKANLARRLGQATPTIVNTVNRQDWRAQYIGVVSKFDVIASGYQTAALTLSREGKPVTKSRIAKILGVKMRAVQSYLKKHPDVLKSVGLSALDHHEHAHGVERYRKAARRMQALCMPMTRKTLAIELGIRYSAVCNYLRKHPEIVLEFGIVLTSDL